MPKRKKKGVNPRSIPRTEADVRAARLEGAENALKIVTFVLKDKLEFPDELLAIFNTRFNEYMEQIKRREISISDIEEAAKEERDLEFCFKE